MERAIAITRSQLRQVIEDYIAASRVGDTLSYVETAKLSAAEAAESSTERIWEGLCDQAESCGSVTMDEQSTAMAIGVAMHDLAEKALHGTEFTCVEDLAAGQIVIVNSRGMIEGKRDEADKPVCADIALNYTFSFFQAKQLLAEFMGNTDAKVAVAFRTGGKVFALNLQFAVAPVELTDTIGGEPEPESPDDFF